MKTENPICGNCGKPLKDHCVEDQIYCTSNTTADIFTDEPSSDIIFEMFENHYPELYRLLVKNWKRENGHL